MKFQHLPPAQGLYDPAFEHDSCGVSFVCNVKGVKTNKIVQQGLTSLIHMEHRGATGSDPLTGDGAGILIQMPHKFFQKVARKEGFTLPEFGKYGTGMIFLPSKKDEREKIKAKFEEYIKSEGQEVLAWRKVPVDSSKIGKTAQSTEPVIEQVFVKSTGEDAMAFERKLYIIRKQVENWVRGSDIEQKTYFYVPNLSYRTYSFKGQLMPDQVGTYFVDLQDEDVESALALVHSRYSTNTFPTWDLAQPFRFLAHNGEINTLRGNINWTKARESLMQHDVWGKDLAKVFPVIVPNGSDSATIDNVFELLLLSGRSLPHAMLMLIPGAWEHNQLMKQEYRDFYRFHMCLSEPWDGPAAMCFTDGSRIGAVLDRNGLRPARYIETKDDMVIMASEVGTLPIDPANIAHSGRLEPGKIFFIDTVEGRIVQDEEIKDEMSAQKPYKKWLDEHMLELDQLKGHKTSRKIDDRMKKLLSFGYSREDLEILIGGMAGEGKEPTGSMGVDIPHAVLSDKPRPVFDYFKQLFAQVTNPAIDPIREKVVMSLDVFMGPEKNFLDETPEHCNKLWLKDPILKDSDLEKIRHIDKKGFKSITISTLFDAKKEGALVQNLDRICKETEKAIDNGYNIVILSDVGVDEANAALPGLLAVGAVHQHLVKKSLRTRIGLILESGEPREVHHFNTLFGFGADAINPYMVYEAIQYMIETGDLELSYEEAVKNYTYALHSSILKILSKMGISTLQSYRGAQIFECLGLKMEVIDRCFTNTTSRISGVGFDILEKEALIRHNRAYLKLAPSEVRQLPDNGIYKWRRGGEKHLWSPLAIAYLQDSTRKNDWETYKKFAKEINNQSDQVVTLRGLLKFKTGKSIPIDQVEPAESIMKRFATGAMSYGSISGAAHENLAIAMNRIGAMSNTGEGGEDPARFTPMPNGDSKRSKIKQIASGRFGVTTNYLANADELQIKIAQGAKPGEGGQLPGHKVSPTIARTRHTTPGVTLISPPPHHDIYSIEDLAQLIFDLKNSNPAARISVKLVSEVGVGTVAAGVAKGHADMILISGGDGGTGASPESSLKHAGLPFELGISETHQTLVLNDLRSRVRLQTDGQMRTGKDVAVATMLGAEEWGISTAALVVSGCVMLRHCHLNNCSVGVATQDDVLQTKFSGKPEYVVNYFRFVAEELREIMASVGVKTINELVGRTDLLEVNKDLLTWKTKDLDLSRILYRPEVDKSVGTFKTMEQDHAVDNVLDRELIKKCMPALEKTTPVSFEQKIINVNRTTGAMLSGEVCKRYGESRLPLGTIHIKFTGEAGQSFGAFLVKGITFELEGLANDYIGKGMYGGKIVVYPHKKADYKPEDNILIGNTTFYGAIQGEAYIRGRAGERFCIRNSGLNAVVEAVGDHGCEYMTGGRVVVLGPTGRNFAAGMSGGVAYIYDPKGEFPAKCNMDMVELQKLEDEDDISHLGTLIENHYKETGSEIAKELKFNFLREMKHFVKVMPLEYKRILEAQKQEEELGVSEVSDG